MNKMIQTNDQTILKLNFKILFSFALCLGFILPSESQDMEWAPVGATWHFNQVSVLGPEVSYTTVESVESTFYQGKECKRLDGHFSFCSWSVPDEGLYTYKSNDSVYFYHPQLEEFKLLYDFGASVGDTWTIHNIALDEENPNSIEIRVDSTDMTTIDGVELRVLYTSMVENPPDSPWGFGGMIIENIGELGNMLPFHLSCDPVPSGMRCYQDETIFYQISEVDCDAEYTVSTGPEIKPGQFKIAPNPGKDMVRLTWDGQAQPEKIQIFNSTGQLIRSFAPKIDGNRLELDVSDFGPGNYLIKIRTSSSEVWTSKLVVR